MKQNNKVVKMEFQLPGFDKKDIKVKIDKDKAIISAEKTIHNKVEKKDFFHEEKTYRSFSYMTTLPKVKPNKTKTEFKRGVLRITAPKEK